MKTKQKSSKSTKTTRSINVIPSIGVLKRKTDRSEFSENTWVVFRGPSGERKPLLFSEKLSRDTVRGAYSKMTGTNKERTRSRRLKNY